MMLAHANLDSISYLFVCTKSIQGFKTLYIQPTNQEQVQLQEDISEYVAQLQLHMALQARNLVPTLNSTDINSSRQQMLEETQAIVEKIASRQSI